MFCKEQVAQLCDRTRDIRALGAELAVIGNGSPEQAGWFVEDQALNVPVFSDPDLATYRALGAKRGMSHVLHPGMLLSTLRALHGGYRQSARMGDAIQLGGVAIIRPDGSVPARFLSRFPGDHPAPDDIVVALRRAQDSAGS